MFPVVFRWGRVGAGTFVYFRSYSTEKVSLRHASAHVLYWVVTDVADTNWIILCSCTECHSTASVMNEKYAWPFICILYWAWVHVGFVMETKVCTSTTRTISERENSRVYIVRCRLAIPVSNPTYDSLNCRNTGNSQAFKVRCWYFTRWHHYSMYNAEGHDL